MGSECSLSVNTADRHTSSHMAASVIDSCFLSWTKWKMHAFESDTWLSVFNWCIRSPAARGSPHPFQRAVAESAHSGLQSQSPTWLAGRIWTDVTWCWALRAHMHATEINSPFTAINLYLFTCTHATLQHSGPVPGLTCWISFIRELFKHLTLNLLFSSGFMGHALGQRM